MRFVQAVGPSRNPYVIQVPYGTGTVTYRAIPYRYGSFILPPCIQEQIRISRENSEDPDKLAVRYRYCSFDKSSQLLACCSTGAGQSYVLSFRKSSSCSIEVARF